jgi:hypothetical protein
MRLWRAIDQTPTSLFRHLFHELAKLGGEASRLIPERLSTSQRGVDAELREADRQILPFHKIESAHRFD